MEKRFHLDKLYINNPLQFGDWRLFQIGRLFCTDQTVIEKHPHLGWFELTVVTEGKGIVQTNDISIPVARGDIYFSFPFDFHGICSDKNEPLKYDFLSFQTDDPLISKELDVYKRQDETLRGGKIAVRLKIPSPHNLPLSCGDQLFDFSEQFGIVSLRPAVENRLVVRKYKVVLTAQVHHAPKG